LAAANRLGRARSLLGINYFNFKNRLDISRDNFTDMTQQGAHFGVQQMEF
jgi:outer membrane receptor for ferrienterochelin and colicins